MMSNSNHLTYYPSEYQCPRSARQEETTEEWGRKAWAVFHQTTFGYRAGMDEQRYYQFYMYDFRDYIKCQTCLAHYLEIIESTPIRLYSMEDLFAWTVDVHNQINRRLRKPIISLYEAKRIWFQGYEPCCPHSRQTIRLL